MSVMYNMHNPLKMRDSIQPFVHGPLNTMSNKETFLKNISANSEVNPSDMFFLHYMDSNIISSFQTYTACMLTNTSES